MPTRKITERERLTIFARTASDDELAQALEILTVESRVRGRAGKQPADKADKKPRARKEPTAVPGPPNPPKPADQAKVQSLGGPVVE